VDARPVSRWRGGEARSGGFTRRVLRLNEPQESKIGESRSGRQGQASKESQDPRVRTGVSHREREAAGAEAAKDLEGPLGDEQGQGGSGKPTARYVGYAGYENSLSPVNDCSRP